jgi:hypothetical protein
MPSEYDILLQEPQTGSEYDILLAPTSFEQVPGELAFPIEGGGIQKADLSDPRISPTEREETWNTLDGKITPEFARDFMLLAAGAVNARSLRYSTGKEEFPVETPRQVFDAAVQNQLLAPTFDADPKFGAFKSHWDQYKAEMNPSMLGAAGRGAVSAIGSTAGGITAGAIASPMAAAGPVGVAGVIASSMAGGTAGAAAQEFLAPSSSREVSQRMFDEAKDSTRRARLAGEIVPSLATETPTFIGPNNALSKLAKLEMPKQVLDFAGSALAKVDVAAAKKMLLGGAIGGAIPAAIDALTNKAVDLERVVQGIFQGGAMQGNSLGKLLHDRLASTTQQALEIRNKLFQRNVSENARTDAIFRLQEAGSVNQNGVRLMSGELVGGMLARMQRVLGATADSRISERMAANERAIAMNLADELAPEGAPAERTRAYAEEWQNRLLAEADELHRALSEAGQTQYTDVLDTAMRQSAAAHAAREQGILNAETTEALTIRNLEAAVADIKLRAGIREPAAKAVRDILVSEGDVAIKAASQLYETPKASPARTTFDNTYQALRWSQGSQGFGESGRKDKAIAPAIVSRLLKLRKPSISATGRRRHERPITELITDYRNVNQAISEAAEKNQDNTVRVLMKIREGMQKDLDAAGNVWPELQEANKAWKEAMRVYGDGQIGKVVDSRNAIPTSETLDKIFKGKSGTQDLSAAQQLRAAIKERPEGIAAVTDWFVHRLALKGGKTSESMSSWLNRPEQVEALNSFPEARATLENHIRDIRNAEVQVAGAQTAMRAAQAVPNVNPSHVDPAVRTAAREQRDAVMAIARDRQTDMRRQIASNAFSNFVGADPQVAIRETLNSRDPVGAMRQAVQMADQDPSGEAVQGLRNALRDFIGEAVEKNGRPLSADNQPDRPLGRGELALSLAKLDDFMKTSSPMRAVIEVAYGPDSVELRALDMAREQMEIWSRTQQLTPGSSPTMDLAGLQKAMEGQVQDNLLGLISKVGKGLMPRSSAFNKLTWLGDMFSGVYNRGLEQMVERFQVDATLDPNLAIEALLPLRPENMPRINAVLKNYFVSKDQLYKEVPQLPFSVLNTKEETLGEGKFLRDKVTGYSIQAVNGKFRTYDAKSRQIGISDTLQAAKDKAVMEDLKKLPPLKPRK